MRVRLVTAFAPPSTCRPPPRPPRPPRRPPSACGPFPAASSGLPSLWRRPAVCPDARGAAPAPGMICGRGAKKGVSVATGRKQCKSHTCALSAECPPPPPPLRPHGAHRPRHAGLSRLPHPCRREGYVCVGVLSKHRGAPRRQECSPVIHEYGSPAHRGRIYPVQRRGQALHFLRGAGAGVSFELRCRLGEGIRTFASACAFITT